MGRMKDMYIDLMNEFYGNAIDPHINANHFKEYISQNEGILPHLSRLKHILNQKENKALLETLKMRFHNDENALYGRITFDYIEMFDKESLENPELVASNIKKLYRFS